MQTRTPSKEQKALAHTSSRVLATSLGDDLPLRYILSVRPGEQSLAEPAVEIPKEAVALLAEILEQMARGNAVMIIPLRAEMTTQEAADFLNVSRPFLVGLLEAGKIPHRKVGTRRRMYFQDVLDYKNCTNADREHTLAELAAQAQELNMGY